MPEKTPPSDTGFLLGDISATLRNVDNNVTALRSEMGDLGKRVTLVENKVTEINSERDVMVPDYQGWKHKISNTVAEHDAKWHKLEGSTSMFKKYSGSVWTVFALLLVLATSLVTWSITRSDTERRYQAGITVQQDARTVQQDARATQQNHRDTQQDAKN